MQRKSVMGAKTRTEAETTREEWGNTKKQETHLADTPFWLLFASCCPCISWKVRKRFCLRGNANAFDRCTLRGKERVWKKTVIRENGADHRFCRPVDFVRLVHSILHRQSFAIGYLVPERIMTTEDENSEQGKRRWLRKRKESQRKRSRKKKDTREARKTGKNTPLDLWIFALNVFPLYNKESFIFSHETWIRNKPNRKVFDLLCST